MSFPVEFDFAVVKIGDGATTEVFTIACGLQDVTVNTVANTQDRFSRDCAKPGSVPVRKVKATGTQQDITGSGLIDKAQVAIYLAALGKVKNYKVEAYAANGTDAGLLLGTFSGGYMMTASNISTSLEGTGSAEITLASDGAFVWTPAP